MKIEIAEPGRMTQTGSSLIRLIQNNDMPVLDLLVRESIQNSLDARIPNSRYVEVNYLTGEFNSKKLSKELEEITEALTNRFPEKSYDYIAIRDSNTVGLTGEMNYKNVKNNVYGNLLKLVYEICKPQEDEGAGGSWGIGKTVYFRIGIGLVIYYSRIKKENGKYESRLAASYVENETDRDAMIPSYKGLSRRGIAWWGETIEENVTQPVTDEKYIESFLEIFNIEPYADDKTGTTIIIPYIDSESLLSNNRVEYLNDQDEPIIPFWGHKIEDYISVAVQRWYAPRLNNPNYQQGAYLRLRVNNDGLGMDSMEPVFKVVQALYNRAVHVDEEDILSEVEEKYVESIQIRKYLEDQVIGNLAFVKVTKDELKMNAPWNKPAPYMYFNNEIRDAEVNRPTICYTRKPAMIVSYENVGAWVSNISPSSSDEYIIGLFVLNSLNRLRNAPTDTVVEEYIRKSEMADHSSWSDWSEGSYNPRFVSKIQQNVSKIIGKQFAVDPGTVGPRVNSGLGKMFGELLLPPEGFGKNATPTPKRPPGPTVPSNRGLRFGVDTSKIKYLPGTMIAPLILETVSSKKIKRVGFNIQIDSESKKIALSEWEEAMGLDTPFSIKEVRIKLDMVDGKKASESGTISDELYAEIEDIQISLLRTDKGTCYGINMVSEEPHHVKMRFDVMIDLYKNDVKPAFVYEKGGA